MKRAVLSLKLSRILLQEKPLKERLQAFLETLLSHPWLSLEPRGAIFLRRGERLVLMAEHRLDEPLKSLCAQVELGRCLCGRVGLTGRPLVARDLNQEHETRYPGMPPHGHAIFPLRVEERVLGVLNLYQAPGARLSPAARATLEEAAGLLALALLRERAERVARVLHRAGELFFRAGDEAQYLRGLAALLVEEGYALAWVGEALPEGRVRPLEAAGAVGYLEGLRVRWDVSPEGQGPTGRAIRTGKPQVLRDVGLDPSYGPWRYRAQAFGLASSAALPLWVGGRVYGALNVYAQEADAFDEEELALLQDLAHLAGEALGRFRAEARAHLLAQVVEQVPESVFITDLEGRITYANPALFRHTGYAPEEVLGENPRIFKSGRHPQAFYQELWRTLERGEVFRAVFWNRRKDGRPILEHKLLTPLKDPQGRVVAYASTGREVTREYSLYRMQEVLLRHTLRLLQEGTGRGFFQDFLREALEAIPGAEGASLLLRGKDGLFRFVAAVGYRLEALRALSLAPEEVHALGLPEAWGRVAGEAYREHARALPQEKGALLRETLGWEGLRERLYARLEVEGEVAGVLYVDAFQASFPEEAPEAFRLLALQLEAALRYEAAQKRARYLAYHDPLTGLGNRTLLEEEAPFLLREGVRTLLLLDLEAFREINEAYGRATGDEALKVLAGRLLSLLPPGGRLFRIGGDEFLFLLPLEPAEVEAFFARVREAVTAPVVLPQGEVRLGARAGVAVVPREGADLVRLLRQADLALERALRAGQELAFFDPGLEATFQKRRETLRSLEEALAQEALVFFAQPIADLHSGEPVALELLLRWPKGEDFVPAAAFIPLAEETGLIRELDLYALRRAAGLRHPLPLHLNLSPKTLLDPRFLPLAEEVAARLASSPRAKTLPLRLEITEYALAEPRAAEVLEALGEMGFCLVLDDFGQGYASLNTLVHHPFRQVKVDRGFVRGIGNPRAEAALRAALRLAEELGLSVVAEGVERETQRAWLLQVGYRLGQGYLLGRPAPLSGA